MTIQWRQAAGDSAAHKEGSETKVFTVVSAGEKLGLPISCVQTIFRVGKITAVPMAAYEILGLINLRGKINTAASLRRILGTPGESRCEGALAICIEHRSEQFALIVDEIGDVITVPDSARIEEPPNVDPKRAAMTSGVFRLESEILPLLDVGALLDFGGNAHRTAPSNRRDGEPA